MVFFEKNELDKRYLGEQRANVWFVRRIATLFYDFSVLTIWSLQPFLLEDAAMWSIYIYIYIFLLNITFINGWRISQLHELSILTIQKEESEVLVLFSD